MLASEATNFGMTYNASALKYWHLPITKNYSLPKYYIGQPVLHCISHPKGEILHPVTVIGMFWNCREWIYMIELPLDHPEYVKNESELDEVAEHELEAM